MLAGPAQQITPGRAGLGVLPLPTFISISAYVSVAKQSRRAHHLLEDMPSVP